MIHIASKIGSENVENWSLMHFYIFGRFCLILFTVCFPWWTWVITNSSLWTVRHLAAFACSFWESSYLNFWLAGRLVAVGVMYALPSVSSSLSDKSTSRLLSSSKLCKVSFIALYCQLLKLDSFAFQMQDELFVKELWSKNSGMPRIYVVEMFSAIPSFLKLLLHFPAKKCDRNYSIWNHFD